MQVAGKEGVVARSEFCENSEGIGEHMTEELH
ncbi:MAG: hypothetical protein RIT16_270, partial [Actinomycetota bacterium]